MNKAESRLNLEKSLFNRSLETAAFTSVLVGASAVLRLISNLIVTRFLVPEDYAVFGLIVSIRQGFVMMSDVGISQTVMKSDTPNDQDFIGTLLTIQMLRGGLITILMIGLSLLVLIIDDQLSNSRSVYSDQRLVQVMLLMSFVSILDGTASIGLLIRQREMSIRIVSILQLVAQIFGIVGTVTYAYLHQSVYALVVGTYLNSLSIVVLSHLVIREGRVLPRFNKEIAGDAVNYGRWFALSSIVTFFYRRGDRLFLGAILDQGTLGLYEIARTWLDIAISFSMKIQSSTVLPGLAELVRKGIEIEKAYYKYRYGVDGISFVGALFLAFALPALFPIIYKADYHAAVTYFDIFAPYFLLTTYWSVGSSLVAYRQAVKNMQVWLFDLLFLFMSMIAFMRNFGPEMVPHALCIGAFIGVPFRLWISRSYITPRFSYEAIVITVAVVLYTLLLLT